MPQLSLYIDEKTLRKLKVAAKIERLSISKYAAKKLNEILNDKWPEHYGELYGSIRDDTFSVPKASAFERDAPREEL